MSDLKLNPRIKPSPYTGSAFDVTMTMNITERPGGFHHGPSKELNVGAFSHCKKTNKLDPHDFTKRGTGNGGTIDVRSTNLTLINFFDSTQRTFLKHLHHVNKQIQIPLLPLVQILLILN